MSIMKIKEYLTYLVVIAEMLLVGLKFYGYSNGYSNDAQSNITFVIILLSFIYFIALRKKES